MKTIEQALKLLADSEIINEDINLNKKYQGIFSAQGETAKIVLDALTSVTTLKRIGMETWAVRDVLKNGKLTGNYWLIALIRKLNELSEIDGRYPFDIGGNRNKDLNFTFIDDEE